MKTLNFFLLIAIIACIISCQKDYEPDIVDPPTTNPPAGSGDSIYLDRIIVVPDDGSGDTAIVSFHYDNFKRVTSITDSLAGSLVPRIGFQYFYNGNDTVPAKSIAYEYDASPTIPDTTISFFSYDVQGRKAKDSVLMYGTSGTKLLSVTDYSYAPGKIFGQNRFEFLIWSLPDTTDYNRDTAIVDLKGNIISNKEYKLIGGEYVLNINSTFTYDNHPSIFANLSILKAHQGFPSGETVVSEYIGYNNITSQDETVALLSNHFTATNTYTYNSRGLPVSQTAVTSWYTEKSKYIYRSL